MSKIKSKKTNITVHNIAEVTKLSASTVSRALNNHPKISQKTKEKVWNTAKLMGYQPNIPAYMHSEKTKTICLMVPEFQNPFYQEVISSVRSFTHQNNYHIFIVSTDDELKNEPSYLSLISDLKIEGIIAVLSDKNSELNPYEDLINKNIPVVFINNPEKNIEACKIVPDIINGAFKATNHLISMGCKNIITITGNPDHPFYADLIEGFHLALSSSNLKYIEEPVISGNLTTNDLEFKLNQVFKNAEIPDAIISPSASTSEQIIEILKSKQYDIPKDVLLVSFDSGKNNTCKNANLSTVNISGIQTGELAVEKLFQQIKNKKITEETVIIPAKFIIRGSTLKM